MNNKQIKLNQKAKIINLRCLECFGGFGSFFISSFLILLSALFLTSPKTQLNWLNWLNPVEPVPFADRPDPGQPAGVPCDVRAPRTHDLHHSCVIVCFRLTWVMTSAYRPRKVRICAFQPIREAAALASPAVTVDGTWAPVNSSLSPSFAAHGRGRGLPLWLRLQRLLWLSAAAGRQHEDIPGTPGRAGESAAHLQVTPLPHLGSQNHVTQNY